MVNFLSGDSIFLVHLINLYKSYYSNLYFRNLVFSFSYFFIGFDLETTPEFKKQISDYPLIDRGHLIANSFVKELIDVSCPTNSYWNKFIQYEPANRAIIDWETRIKTISQQCLNTEGFKQIQSDFYLISGTKPYKEKSAKNNAVEGMAIPQLQWTAMCCVMEIDVSGKKEKVVMSGGYIASNVKPNAKYIESDVDQTLFPIFPRYSYDQMLMDLPMLRKGMIENFEDKTTSADDVTMKAEYFFGDKNPCDVQERKNDWILETIKGITYRYIFF